MISCPSCNHKELAGALFCSNCGAQLVISEEQVATSSFNTDDIGRLSVLVPPPFVPPPLSAPDSRIAILILGSEKVIHISGNDEVTLGRFTKGQTIIPDIDLSPFQAYEAGVSRLHANIDIKGSEITIKDLGSANGTRLNGIRIQPHQEYQIKHGDILTFGRLKVQVLIKE
ncbi:hypothetical protein AMJ86_05590 [bacterium SM23_57]|jgi:hypothetical protein|nr:MAG: hypothetical protein AMJ86_05590 [bacterium SM23_57]